MIPLLFAAVFASACYSDNASPHAHGADNPGLASKKTTTDAPPGGSKHSQQPANPAAGTPDSYGQQSARPGGTRANDVQPSQPQQPGNTATTPAQ
ncbi:MAG TPA: hypothetical protein VGF69_01345 [Thermoanaerobaculia bacterium]|jgi:hypothetical protein